MKPSPAPTEAERALSALFEARSGQFTETALDAARADAFRRFAADGLPHRRVEAYRYTDLKARLRSLPPEAGEADPQALADVLAAQPPLAEDAVRIVIANGRLIDPSEALPDGMSVASILSPEADTSSVGALVAETDDPLTLANVGLFDGGALIRIDGAVERPIEIVHAATEDALVMGRLAVFVAPGASATLTERTLGRPSALNNMLTELTLGEGARLEWVRVADGAGPGTTNLSTVHVRLAERARLEHLTVSTGEGLGRAQVFAHVAGGDAEAHFRAATVAIGERHADTTLVIRHDAVGSRSTEEFRSAVGQGGTAIVQGRIIVDPGAQQTDAKMMSRALYLDDSGEVVNKPELEIFADDVQCGHGATCGDLDEEMVFYLRARGIPEPTARRLLVEAFVLEALERVSSDALRDVLAGRLASALDVMGGRTWT